ncbi:MAG: glycosyl hydrolase family 28-related protein [Candidatus Anstonellales archaeon]
MSGENNNSNSQLIQLSPSSSVGYGTHRLEFYAIDRLNNRSSIITRLITTAKVFNVKDYGAKGDGITDDTQAVRNTIEQARQWSISNNNALTTIYFPAGTYRTRQLKIHSNMILRGAGITKTKLFRIVERDSSGNLVNVFMPSNDPSSTYAGGDTTWFRSFITNYNMLKGQGNRNIGIQDMTINGNGYAFRLDGTENHHNYLIQFKRTDGIYIDNIRLEDSMNWSFSGRESKNINIGYMEIDGNTLRDQGRVNDRNNQDGVNFHGSQHVYIKRLVVYESYDDSLFIGAADTDWDSSTQRYTTPIPAYDIKVDYLEVYRHTGTGGALALCNGLLSGSDLYDVDIKYIKLHNLAQRGMVSIHAHFYGTGEYGSDGVIHDIHIGTIESIGYSRTNKPLVWITSRPRELGYTKYATNRFYNITIDKIVSDYNMSIGSTIRQQGLVIEGINNVVVGANEFTTKNKSKEGYDIDIRYSTNVSINNVYIQRVEGGGWALINIQNSQGILFDNARIPLAKNGALQGGAALRIAGSSSKDVTLRYRELRTNTLIEYTADVPEANKSTIRIERISS